MATETGLTDDDICRELASRAAEGFATDGEILSSVLEALADEHGAEAATPERVGDLARRVFQARAAEERGWPIPTDCDRLDRAFAALERRGIVARQNFTCCQTCGHAEISGELEDCAVPARGYVFFHAQDTERAAEGEGLYLAYGAILPEEASEEASSAAARQVGAEIVEALRAEGLAPRWDGDLKTRLALPLRWRRRRWRG